MKKNQLFVIVFITLYVWKVTDTQAQPFNNNLAMMLQDTLQTYFTAINNIKGMTASVYLPGQGIWQGKAGVSFTGQPITQDMSFGVASNTKLFVATMMLKLAEDNIISLNDSLHKWLPNYTNVDPDITIRQLLSHRSGISDPIFVSPWMDTIIANPSRVFAPVEVIGWLGPRLFPKGASWGYSNVNYILAAMVAKSATGYPISKLIRDSILTPLSLDSTFYDYEEPVVGTLAHRWWNGGSGIVVYDYHNVSRVGLNSAGGAAGALFSNSSEMAQWYHALFSGQLLNATSMTELMNFGPTMSPVQQYSLGLARETTQGLTYWGHGGDTWGYKSKMIYDTCMGAVICGMSNSFPDGMTSIPFLIYRAIKNHVPGCPGAISGLTSVVQGQNNVTYTTAPIANVNTYVWTLPNGATGTSNTSSITINYENSALSGNITVRGDNDYGVGNASSLAITVTPFIPNTTLGNVGINVETPLRNLHIKDVMRLEPRNQPPDNPSEGDIYYDSILKKLRVFDGSLWQNCW
ncbi:MAG: serine hydrolase [Saprospiraceae bacterium]